jgi:hypothetical protein
VAATTLVLAPHFTWNILLMAANAFAVHMVMSVSRASVGSPEPCNSVLCSAGSGPVNMASPPTVERCIAELMVLIGSRQASGSSTPTRPCRAS